jgi:hypothetical protein
MRAIRRFFGFRPALPTVFVGVADAYPQVPELRDEIARLARNRMEAVEIRLTQRAYERLCDELGVTYTTQVCGLPIRIVDAEKQQVTA